MRPYADEDASAALPDPQGLLRGTGEVSRVAKFAGAADIERKADALQELVRAWVSLTR